MNDNRADVAGDAASTHRCDKENPNLQVDALVTDSTADAILESLTFNSESAVASPVPDFGDVVELIENFKQILHPVFCAVEHSRDQVRERLRAEAAIAGERLATLIRRCILRHAEACQSMKHRGCEDAESLAQSKALLDDLDATSLRFTNAFFEKLLPIRKSLLTDIQAAFDGDPACQNFDEVILCYPGLSAVTVHRMAHELHKLGVPFLPRMMAEWSHGETGIDIHPGAIIGDHFFIDHGTGVVIGETVEIGEHVKIYQGVTLGALSFDKDERGELVRGAKRHPTLEDRVVIYANATVLGGKTVVGAGSVIGSNVWITRSVTAGTTVTIQKPGLRMKNQRASDLIDYQI